MIRFLLRILLLFKENIVEYFPCTHKYLPLKYHLSGICNLRRIFSDERCCLSKTFILFFFRKIVCCSKRIVPCRRHPPSYRCLPLVAPSPLLVQMWHPPVPPLLLQLPLSLLLAEPPNQPLFRVRASRNSPRSLCPGKTDLKLLISFEKLISDFFFQIIKPALNYVNLMDRN